MARNREPEKTVKTEPESSEEEKETDYSSEEAESDQETGAGDTKKPLPPPLIKSEPPFPSASTYEDGYETDYESDHDQHTESKPVIVNDPPKSSTGTKKSQALNTRTEPVPPAKRPAKEKELEAKDSKRPKKTKPESVKKETVAKEVNGANKNSNSIRELNSTDNPKTALFQRVWSEEDEIVLLEGMLEYEAKKKSNPITDIDAFLDYIKKNLHVDPNKEQLLRKIRRLKTKYADSKSKGRNFTKPHELATYELSEKIWGNEIATPSTKAIGKTPSKKTNAIENGETEGLMRLEPAKRIICYGGLTQEEKILRIGAELFERDEEIEGSNEWKKLVIEDLELNLKKLDVMRAQMRLVLDKLK